VDEGYHLTRAAVVWDFAQHPARFSHGKLLLYFWLGIFESNPLNFLATGRLGVALFTIVNGSTIYLIGKLLHSHRMGLLALAIYTVLPLAFFFERMALADSFAAAFAGLVAWRSLVFVKHPTLREGAILGVLLGTALLAKLTMGLVPFLPVAAALIYYQWHHVREQVIPWGRQYLPALFLAAAIVIAMWLPILIPAALAMGSDDPFILIDPANLQQLSDAAPVQSFFNILDMLSDYTTWGLYAAIALAIFYLLWQRTTRQNGLFLLAWIALAVLLPLFAATLIRTRYLMPMTMPIALILSYGGVHLWESVPRNTFGKGIQITLVGVSAVWLILYAMPFAYTTITAPVDLPLSDEDWERYMSGNFSGDELRSAAMFIDELDTDNESIITTWGTCQLLFLYMEKPTICLPATSLDEESEQDLLSVINQEREQGRNSAIMVLNNRDSFLQMDSVTWERLALYTRDNIERPVQVWRLTWD